VIAFNNSLFFFITGVIAFNNSLFFFITGVIAFNNSLFFFITGVIAFNNSLFFFITGVIAFITGVFFCNFSLFSPIPTPSAYKRSVILICPTVGVHYSCGTVFYLLTLFCIFVAYIKAMKRAIFLLNIVILCMACSTPLPEQPHWYKGDLHAHSLLPGGAVAHACISDRYARKGYDFIVLDTACYMAGLTKGCLALPGSECRDEKGVWTTAINTGSRIWTAVALREEVRQGNASPNVLTYIPQSEAELASHHLRNIRRGNGLAVLSQYSLRQLTPETAAAIEELKFVEIFDGDTLTEAPWDSLLTRGKQVFATASDTSWAGRAWVMLQADSLTSTSVMNALEQGRFYASSGVMLAGITQQHTHFTVEVDTAATRKQLPSPSKKHHTTDTTRYEITFIAAEGKAVKRITGLKGHYIPQPGDGYVRARIAYSSDSCTYYAWTQPWLFSF
jgi:hypothetical protein